MIIQMCCDCRYARWPAHFAGECHLPTAPPDTTTQAARAQGGLCGHDGTYWEKQTHDENT